MDKESIFAEALKKDSPAELSEFLDRVCAGDDKLRAEIDELVVASRDAGSFLEGIPVEMGGTVRSYQSGRSREAWRELLGPSQRDDSLGKLGPYEITELIGQGGMGVVLRAHDPKLNRVVAIKLLAPELATNVISVRRFLREARAAAAVSHDHVVTIYAIDEDAHPPIIVMEYVDGHSLQKKIDTTGPLDVKSVLRIGMQVAAGLAAAHGQGLVHRDVKPANILLENGIERVKLTDFGLARAIDDIAVTQTGQITGTPQYMSPEQAQGRKLDHRTDLFSLGCVLYAMCTGRAAFRADSAVAVMHRVVHDTPRPIQALNEDIPDWLCEIVDRLLAKVPSDRLDSADEVKDLLGRHLAHLQQPQTVPRPERIVTPEKSLSELAENRLGFWGKVRRFLGKTVIAGRFGQHQRVVQPKRFRETTHGMRRATDVLIAIGVLDLLVVPTVFVWASSVFAFSPALASVASISSMLVSPACGLVLLTVTVIGRRFHVARRTVAGETGVFASLLALLPVTPIHVLAVPASVWALRTFLRGASQTDRRPPNWPFIHLCACGVLLLGSAAFELETGRLSRMWLAWTDRGRITINLESAVTEVYLTGASTGGQGSLIRYRTHAVLHVDAGDYRARWRDESGQEIGSQALTVLPGTDGFVLIPDSAAKVEVNGPLDNSSVRADIASKIYRIEQTQSDLISASSATDAEGAGPLDIVLERNWGAQPRREPVVCLDISPDGQWVASGHHVADHYGVTLWEVEANGAERKILRADTEVRDISFSPDGSKFAWVQADGKLRIAPADSTADDTNFQSFEPAKEPLSCLAWSPDGSRILAGGPTRWHVWDTRQAGERVSLFLESDNATDIPPAVVKVAYSNDGMHFATGHTNGRIIIWRTADSPFILRELRDTAREPFGRAHRGAISGLDFSSDDSRLYSCGQDGLIHEWNVDSGTPTSTNLTANRNPVRALALSPDGTRWAAAGFRQTAGSISLLNRDARAEIRLPLKGSHTDLVTALAFTTDGKYLISGGEDGLIKWWRFLQPLATGSLASDAPHND